MTKMSGPSATYGLFRRAILQEKQVVCRYRGRRRELCPHILGHASGEEKVLAFQFAGDTNSHLPPGGQWRCMSVSEVRDVQLRDGPWFEGEGHAREQTCVPEIDLDINVHVRGRRP